VRQIEFPYQTHASSQNEAVALQIQSRIDFEVSKLLPRLHGLSNLFSDISSLESRSSILELNEVLHTLTTQLHCLQNPLIQVHGQLERPMASVSHGTLASSEKAAAPTTKRDNRVLLPPSPERRQRRKNSHAPF